MDKQLNLPINEPRWTRRMQQLLSTKLEQVERKTQTWIPSALQSKKRKPTKIHTTCGQHDMLNEKAYYHSISSLPQEQDKKAYPDESNSHCSASVSSDHEKDIVPLHQFLRYSMNRSEQRKFQRRRVLQPFKPVYEVEWQKNQWLQFDNQTNSQIERLKQEGFTKIAIRKDKILKRHVSYVNPKDMDVLLELSLKQPHQVTSKLHQPQVISCHQPNVFTIRRAQWWRKVVSGEACLPNWVDQDLCCDQVIMDADSVMAAMTNYSRTSLTSLHPKQTDAPIISQKSSLSQLRTPSNSWKFKSLKYSEPHMINSQPVSLCA
ncbi:hypothetical protein A0J61_02341 [Choanephora cucurbitarum]|uniref:Uncharacterized protein n=1 Tax=Choanephora cucurbitarum TaxID=101091 RepID=A0A1C7NKB8_9FUNG|nr:hypothetical protein A0J61_02341 [Choanephora cucurbitarum]